MRPTRIEGADPRPLGAPRDWDASQAGNCADLFVRREIVDGIGFMRSAWDVEQNEALCLLAGGKVVLGVCGSSHPVVHLLVQAPPADAVPTYACKQVVMTNGHPAARCDAFYPYGGGRRCYCEIPIVRDDAFATCAAVAINHCDDLARREGWLAAAKRDVT